MSMKVGFHAVLAAGTASFLGLGLAACESATNLDVTYGDASSGAREAASADAGAGSAEGGSAEAAAPGTTPEVLSGCPCDVQAGLGCCIPAAGIPFCTGDTTLCTEAKGAHIRCAQPDPTTESACCWHDVTSAGGTTGTVAALSAGCDGGTSACSADSDCAGTGHTKCSVAKCYGGTILIGACGPTAPKCPQP